MSTEILDNPALGRALLARQMLLERAPLPVADALVRLVGLQAQVPGDPYLGLWSRLDAFRPDELGELLVRRRAVRIALMRSTVHLVTARDCLRLRRVLQPAQERLLSPGSAMGRALAGVDLEELVPAARALLDEEPRTLDALGRELARRWPKRDREALALAARIRLPLVQLPPRGLWGKSGRAVCATAEHWLGAPLGRAASARDLVLRYLAAFGPATVADAQSWSGLAGLRPVVERLRPRLAVFRDPRGRELFDLPDAPRPDPETPAPPRFLPQYDNVLLAHDDRSRILPDDVRKRLWTANGFLPTLLVDGVARATWRVGRTRGSATLIVTAFKPLRGAEGAAVLAEGAQLLAFLAPDARARDIELH